jgi:hypothetical protein
MTNTGFLVVGLTRNSFSPAAWLAVAGYFSRPGTYDFCSPVMQAGFGPRRALKTMTHTAWPPPPVTNSPTRSATRPVSASQLGSRRTGGNGSKTPLPISKPAIGGDIFYIVPENASLTLVIPKYRSAGNDLGDSCTQPASGRSISNSVYVTDVTKIV